ncbi:unnamed protein product [Brachionus calyciflorus]|uniref:Peptidase S1 domain-containing protein n=1 Tax=Brachionus calyciflorus TaxID=104777 RepID=A0A814MU64_9BILA|nr:unnamed protein product [Brachionus calyciflorus]
MEEIFTKQNMVTLSSKQESEKLDEEIQNFKKLYSNVTFSYEIRIEELDEIIKNLPNNKSTVLTFLSNEIQNNECIKCGLGGAGLKIVGGEPAREKAWQSLALYWFDYKFDIDGKQFDCSNNICGGTLINQDTVLTAAHCFQKEINITEYNNIKVELNKYRSTFESMYTIYLRAYDITKLDGVTKLKVKSFILHPNYDENSFLNDIAVIKLVKKVNLNDKIQIACLPDKTKIKYPNDNIDAFIAGWGATDTYGEVYPDIFKQAKITIYQSSMCNDFAVESEKNWDKQICAGEYVGGVDSCQGGPLYVRDQIDSSSRYLLAGAGVSYGDKCGLEGSPG